MPGNIEGTGGRTLQETIVKGFRSAASGRKIAADQLLDILRRMQAVTGMDMDVLDVRRNGVGGWGGVDLPPFADGVFEAGAFTRLGIGRNETDAAAMRGNATDAGTGATSGLGHDKNVHRTSLLRLEGRVTRDRRPRWAIERADSRSSSLHYGHCNGWRTRVARPSRKTTVRRVSDATPHTAGRPAAARQAGSGGRPSDRVRRRTKPPRAPRFQVASGIVRHPVDADTPPCNRG